MRQRLRLAAGWLGPSDALLLDEPTNSLDAKGPAVVSDLVRHVAAAGGAVVLASHDLRVIAALCSRVAIMAKGRVAATWTPGRWMGDADAAYASLARAYDAATDSGKDG
jgi:ABC-type multidrug transport system ATPase subunit